MQRRNFIKYFTLGLAATYQQVQAKRPILTSPDGSDAAAFFPESVASGDPTHDGAILWTRVNPLVILHAAEPLFLEVSRDEDFQTLLYRGRIPGDQLRSSDDYTIKADLSKLCPQVLRPASHHYFRFRYRGVYSRTGRFKTMPAPDQMVEALRIAVVTCQNYSHGFFHALDYLADDDIDLVLQLGDFIYEYRQIRTVADPVRSLELGGKEVAHNLEDYRSIYRQYRHDLSLQRAMERHSWVNIWDDHETANNCHWNYDEDSLGIDPRHPLAKISAMQRRQLKLDAQKAWSEYVPARVSFHAGAKHPFEALKIYRSLQAGPMLDLFLTDTRTYRSPQPCRSKPYETDQYDERCQDYKLAFDDKTGDHIMLGKQQRQWLLNSLAQSNARWQLWANQVLFSQLAIRNPLNDKPLAFLAGFDSWDGYQAERQFLLDQIAKMNKDGLVVCTGDMHTYLASMIPNSFESKAAERKHIGLEIMTPAISSPNLATMLSHWGYRKDPSERTLKERLLRFFGKQYLESKFWASIFNENFLQAMNPHFVDFNSTINGYTILEFRKDRLDWQVFDVAIKEPRKAKVTRQVYCHRTYHPASKKVVK